MLAPPIAPTRTEKAMIAPPAREALPLCCSIAAPCHAGRLCASARPACAVMGPIVPLRDLVNLLSTIEAQLTRDFPFSGTQLEW